MILKHLTMFFLCITIFSFFERNSKIDSISLASKNWFDKFGNVYSFQSDTIKTKKLFLNHWWEIGEYEMLNDLMKVKFVVEPFLNQEIKVRSEKKGEITFSSDFTIWEIPNHVDELKSLKLYNKKESIIDSTEFLISFSFKTMPQFLFSGIRAFSLENKTVAEIAFSKQDSLVEKVKLSENDFNSIEELIQILPLETYEDEYYFGVEDGVSYQISIKTNKINRVINCKQLLPKGLDNLIALIDDKFNKR